MRIITDRTIREQEKWDWLLNDVLGNMPLRRLASAFGSSPATMMRLKKGGDYVPGRRMAYLMRHGVYFVRGLCKQSGLEPSQWRNLSLTEQEIQLLLLEHISSLRNPPETILEPKEEVSSGMIESLEKTVSWIRE